MDPKLTLMLALAIASALFAEGFASPLTANFLTVSNALADQGQLVTLNYGISGGNTPYTYNFYVANALNGNVLTSYAASNALTSNTYTFQLPVTSPSNSIVNTVSVFGFLTGLAFDSKSNTVYAIDGVNIPGNVFTIDPTTNTVANTVSISGADLEGIVFNPFNNNIYVTSKNNNKVYVMDPTTNTVVNTIGVGSAPVGIAFDPVNDNVYVVNHQSATVSVISPANTIVNTITVNSLPTYITFDSFNNGLYVGTDSSLLSVIDTSTNSLSSSINLPNGATGVGFDSANNAIYVSVGSQSKVLAIGPTNTIVNTVIAGSGAGAIAFASSSGNLYVANHNADTVSIIGPSNTVLATVTVGGGPAAVAYNPNDKAVYVANQNSHTISLIRTGSCCDALGTLDITATATDSSSASVQLTNTVMVNYALAANSITATNSIADQGQYVKLTYTIRNGTSPFTYNFVLSNTVNGNVITFTQLTNSLLSNSVTIALPVSNDDLGTIRANAIAADGATTPQTANLITSITVKQQLAAGSLSISATNVLQGNLITLTYNIIGGNSAYTYNFYVTNSLTGNVVANLTVSNDLTTNSTGLWMRKTDNLARVIAAPVASPYAVAMNPTNTMLYVSNSGNNTITVFDAATNTPINSIKTTTEIESFLFNPANGKLYAADGSSSSGIITVIDPSTNTVVNTISADSAGAYSLVFNPANNDVYAAIPNTNHLRAIDSVTNAVVNTVLVGTSPRYVVFNPANNDLYVSNYNGGTVSVVDPTTNTVVNTIGGFTNPFGMVFDPISNVIYVANSGGTTIATVNTLTNSIVNTIGIGSSPEFISLDQSANKLYVTVSSNAIVQVIDTTTNAVANTIGTAPVYSSGVGNAAYMHLNTATNTLYVASQQGGLGIIDTAANSLSDVIPDIYTLNYENPMAFSPVGNATYLTIGATPGYVVVIDKAGRVTKSISVGGNPYGVAYDPLDRQLYVTNNGDSTISVINPATNTVVNTIGGLNSPQSIVYAGNFMYVYNSGDSSVAIVNTITNSVLSTVSGFVNGGYGGMAFDPTSGKVFISSTCNSNSNDVVAVVDISTATISSNMVGFNCPGWMAFAPASGDIYVPNTQNSIISVANVLTGEITNSVATAAPWIGYTNNPWFAAYDNITNTVYVATAACSGADRVYAINTTTNKEADNITVYGCPEGIAFNPAANETYVLDNNNDTVSVVNSGPYYDSLGTLDLSVTATDSASTAAAASLTSTITVMGRTGKKALTATATGNPGSAGYYTPVTITFNGTSTTNNQSAWSLFVDGILFGKTASIINWTEQASPGTYSFIFSNPGNSNYTNYTLGTTLKVSGLGTGGGAGGGSQSSVTSTVSSTTVTTTAGSTSVSTTTIPQVNATGSNHTITINATTPITVNFHNVGVRITIRTNSTGGVSISVSVTDATLHSPSPPGNLTKLAAYNITVNGSASSVVAELPYQCTAGSSSLRPYILKNGTWVALQQFSVNSGSCSVTVTVPKDPIVALMQVPPQPTTSTTTIQGAAAGPANSYKLAGTLAVAIAIMVAIAIYLRYRSARHRPYPAPTA